MRRCLISILGSIIMVCCAAVTHGAAETGPVLDKKTSYIIVKGDTLWDISDKFYHDPFLWPRLWQHNQYIANPHLIFPDDRIYLYPYRVLIRDIEAKEIKASELARALKPGPPLPAPPAKVDLFSYPEIFSAGFIAEDLETIGNVIGARDDKELLSKGDEVFLNFKENINMSVGEKFTVLRFGEPIVHPITHIAIGKKVNIVGLVQVKQINGKLITGEITLSFESIQRGDLLGVYISPKQKLTITTFEKPKYGWIIATKEKKEVLVEGDIIYVDRGANDGMKPGHIFNILRRGKWILSPVSKEKVKLPDEPIGRLVIIGTQKKTSTGLITKSSVPIYQGDGIVGVIE